MQVVAASEPGSPDKPNEDGVVITASMVAILDGATVRTDTGCIHGVPWYVEHVSESLRNHSELSPTHALAVAIEQTAAAHSDTCDLSHPATPSAAVAMVCVNEDSIQYLVLGDVTLAIETTNELRLVVDNRVDGTAIAERAVADGLPAGSQAKIAALVRMKRAELAARNVEGGYWIAAADSSAVSHSLTGEIPLVSARRAVLLTDGAARAVNTFKSYDWPDVFLAVASAGPAALIKKVRIAEESDPTGNRYPRNKIHDDATVAAVTF